MRMRLRTARKKLDSRKATSHNRRRCPKQESKRKMKVRHTINSHIRALGPTWFVVTVPLISLFCSITARGQVTTNGTLVPGNIFVSVNGHLPLGNDSFNGTVLQFTPQGAQSTLIPTILHPRGVAFDAAGNFFVTSIQNSTNTSTIYKVRPDGTVTTFATSTGGEFGSLAVDAQGNAFATDTDTSNPVLPTSIVRITPSGVQSLVVSFPVQYFGLAFNGAGDLFAVNTDDGIVYEVSPDGTESPFVNASDPNSIPTGIVFDTQGNLFVSTEGNAPNDTILKFTPAGAKSIFASGLNNPRGLTFDAQGNLFVAELNANGDILEFSPSGSVSVFASGLVAPVWIAIAPQIATNKNQCKNGGWQMFVRANGTRFKNQGDCIQYVNTGK